MTEAQYTYRARPPKRPTSEQPSAAALQAQLAFNAPDPESPRTSERDALLRKLLDGPIERRALINVAIAAMGLNALSTEALERLNEVTDVFTDWADDDEAQGR